MNIGSLPLYVVSAKSSHREPWDCCVFSVAALRCGNPLQGMPGVGAASDWLAEMRPDLSDHVRHDIVSRIIDLNDEERFEEAWALLQSVLLAAGDEWHPAREPVKGITLEEAGLAIPEMRRPISLEEAGISLEEVYSYVREEQV